MTLPSPSRSRCWCWSPSVIFGRRRTALLVLNQRPVSVPLLISLWNLSTVRVCVDGGANQWHRITHGEHQNDIVQPIPDLVTGDFDSVLPEVLETYRSNPVCRVIPTPDQDLTDFSKALKEVSAPRYFESFDQVVAFVEHTGRLDQIFANIETLFHAKRLLRRDPEDKEPKPVFLVSSSSLTWLLDSGTHKILLPSSGISNSHVGLIPIGQPVQGVITSGLKWNLDGSQELAFGSLVSTSNAFKKDASHVEIKTEKELLFTMEIQGSDLLPEHLSH